LVVAKNELGTSKRKGDCAKNHIAAIKKPFSGRIQQKMARSSRNALN
jgi:hypothetical protein